ncbi:MAG TPA: hypothetical protein VN577_21675 [Terriglobales bacterium]|nr:hypothetical protein [Terriglobales bacterium]
MNHKENNNAEGIRKSRVLILTGALAGLLLTVACSDNPKDVVKAAQPEKSKVVPAVLNSTGAKSNEVEVKPASFEKMQPKAVTFKSRDYGISFEYPWQYSRLSAKTIANDESLKPKPDGYEGQFSLVRVDVPKGFYPDTNFDRGYFTLSLNEDISKEECESSLGDTPLTSTVNGTSFRWLETDTGGRGSASKVRNYVTYANYTCYEIELGVNTRNDSGLAREVEPDQVLKRLESIMSTVKVAPEAQPVKTASASAVQN